VQNRAEVVGVGPGRVESGQVVKPVVEVGDVVLMENWGGQEIEVGGEKYLVVREQQIVGVIYGGK
jgi:chaperonin GroES